MSFMRELLACLAGGLGGGGLCGRSSRGGVGLAQSQHLCQFGLCGGVGVVGHGQHVRVELLHTSRVEKFATYIWLPMAPDSASGMRSTMRMLS